MPRSFLFGAKQAALRSGFFFGRRIGVGSRFRNALQRACSRAAGRLELARRRVRGQRRLSERGIGAGAESAHSAVGARPVHRACERDRQLSELGAAKVNINQNRRIQRQKEQRYGRIQEHFERHQQGVEEVF